MRHARILFAIVIALALSPVATPRAENHPSQAVAAFSPPASGPGEAARGADIAGRS